MSEKIGQNQQSSGTAFLKRFYEEGTKSFFELKFFRPNETKNLNFWPFLVKNSINLVSLQSSIDVEMHSAKWPQYKPFEMGEKKKFKISVGIDLEWSKTCFKTKISILKFFPVDFFRNIGKWYKILFLNLLSNLNLTRNWAKPGYYWSFWPKIW